MGMMHHIGMEGGTTVMHDGYDASIGTEGGKLQLLLCCIIQWWKLWLRMHQYAREW